MFLTLKKIFSPKLSGDQRCLFSEKYTVVWIVMLVALAGCLRILFFLHTGILSRDSILYIQIIDQWHNLGLTELQKNVPEASNMMPMYLYLSVLLRHLGLSATAAGITINILVGSLLTALIYLLSREFGLSRFASGCAAFFWAMWPFGIKLACQVQRDMLFIFFYILSLWMILRGIRKNSVWEIFFSGFFAMAASYTRIEGIEIIALFFLCVWWLPRRIKVWKTSIFWVSGILFFSILFFLCSGCGGMMIQVFQTRIKGLMQYELRSKCSFCIR